MPVEEIAPAAGRGPAAARLHRRRDGRPLRLTLKDQAIADAALPGHSQAYRHLDTGVLETLLLKGALGLSDEDISHFNGLFYARDTDEALAMVRSGEYDAAFLMRPTPVEQVRDVAAAGENMPPKSTFFFPEAAHRAAVQPAFLGLAGGSMHGMEGTKDQIEGIEMTETQGLTRMKATARRDGGTFRHTVQVRDHQLTVDEPLTPAETTPGPTRRSCWR